MSQNGDRSLLARKISRKDEISGMRSEADPRQGARSGQIRIGLTSVRRQRHQGRFASCEDRAFNVPGGWVHNQHVVAEIGGRAWGCDHERGIARRGNGICGNGALMAFPLTPSRRSAIPYVLGTIVVNRRAVVSSLLWGAK